VGAAAALAMQQRQVWSILGHAAAGTAVALVAHAVTCPPKPKEASDVPQKLSDKVRGAVKATKDSMDKM
jgi:hypothetical protein